MIIIATVKITLFVIFCCGDLFASGVGRLTKCHALSVIVTLGRLQSRIHAWVCEYSRFMVLL